jgi:electron transfer flavoprotein beta subunit
MRILTVVRQVLDAEESVSIQDGNVALDGRKLVMDTMDEYGVDEALRLREGAAAGAEVNCSCYWTGAQRGNSSLSTGDGSGSRHSGGDRRASGCDCRKQRGRAGGS